MHLHFADYDLSSSYALAVAPSPDGHGMSMEGGVRQAGAGDQEKEEAPLILTWGVAIAGQIQAALVHLGKESGISGPAGRIISSIANGRVVEVWLCGNVGRYVPLLTEAV